MVTSAIEADFANKSSQAPAPASQHVSSNLSLPVAWTTILAVSAVSYVTLCYLLRFQRLHSMRSRHKFTDRASLARMTNEDAHAIMKTVVTFEFPKFYDLALRLALFRTYAMKNVAKLLGASSDLRKISVAGKRYEDTAVLYSCFSEYAPTSALFHKAVARTNFLHAPYIKAGNILNEDLLYVLYAGIVEPIRIVGLYDWRPLSDMEVAAAGTFWKYVGEGMQIDYKAELGKDQWKDGIEFVEDLTKWSLKYEDANMGPREEVYLLGQVLMELMLNSYASFTRPYIREVLLVLMGDRMRYAFGFPEPSVGYSALAFSLLYVRKQFARYLTLPRFRALKYLSDPDPKTGRINHYQYMREPWYNPSTLETRWSLVALFTWATGGTIPGDRKEMKPEGFLFEDLGPHRVVGEGVKEAPVMEDLVKKSVTPGCPFSLGK